MALFYFVRNEVKKIMKQIILILILICICGLFTGCFSWNFGNTNEIVIIPNQADNELLDAIISLIDENPGQIDEELLEGIFPLITEDWWNDSQLLNLIIENDLIDQAILIINENKNWIREALFNAVVLLINEDKVTKAKYFDGGVGVVHIIVGIINENKLFNTLVKPEK